MSFDYALFRSHLATRSLGHELQHFATLPSTSAYAKQLARQGLASEAGLVVIADQQTGGYGQHGRKWASQEGRGLYFTVLMPAKPAPLLTLMVGVAMIDALSELAGSEELRLKWVNDLVLRGRKLGGILVEACQERWMAIGVGINLRDVPQEDGIGLSSLLPLAAQAANEPELPWRNERILAALLNHLERWNDRLAAGDAETVRRRWEAVSVTIGQEVRVSLGEREVVGLARGIDPTGALEVETNAGRVEVFTSGTVRRSDGAYC